MLTTSVNESGFKPINEYELIVKEYDNLVDKIYEANEPSSDLSSTVVLLANNEVKVLREGQISLKMINECLNR